MRIRPLAASQKEATIPVDGLGWEALRRLESAAQQLIAFQRERITDDNAFRYPGQKEPARSQQGDGLIYFDAPTGRLMTSWNGRPYRAFRLAEYIDLRDDAGAMGDGVADDTAAINHALDMAAQTTPPTPIYAPSGIFNTNGLHELNGLDNLVIFGAGRGVSIFRITHATNDLFGWGVTGVTPVTTNEQKFIDFGVMSDTVTRTDGYVFAGRGYSNNGGPFLQNATWENLMFKHQANGWWIPRYIFCEIRHCFGQEWRGTTGYGIRLGQNAAPTADNQGSEFYVYDTGIAGIAFTNGVIRTYNQLRAGLWIEDCDAVYVERSGFCGVENNIRIQANASGHSPTNNFFVRAAGDGTYSGDTFYITGGGTVDTTSIVNGWYSNGGAYPSNVLGVVDASDTMTTELATGWAVNQPITYHQLGTAGFGLVDGTTYYVKTISGANVTLSATPGGATINLTPNRTFVLGSCPVFTGAGTQSCLRIDTAGNSQATKINSNFFGGSLGAAVAINQTAGHTIGTINGNTFQSCGLGVSAAAQDTCAIYVKSNAGNYSPNIQGNNGQSITNDGVVVDTLTHGFVLGNQWVGKLGVATNLIGGAACDVNANNF